MIHEELLEKIKEECDIPLNAGENWILVNLILNYGLKSGIIKYGFNWKRNCGEREFNSLEECLNIIRQLKVEFMN